MSLCTRTNGFQGEIAGKLSCGCLFALVVQEIDTRFCTCLVSSPHGALYPEPCFNQNTSLSSHEHLKVLILLIQTCFRPGAAKMRAISELFRKALNIISCGHIAQNDVCFVVERDHSHWGTYFPNKTFIKWWAVYAKVETSPEDSSGSHGLMWEVQPWWRGSVGPSES